MPGKTDQNGHNDEQRFLWAANHPPHPPYEVVYKGLILDWLQICLQHSVPKDGTAMFTR